MKNIYKLISAIFIPLFMPTYGMLILFVFPQFSFVPTKTKAIIILVTFVLTTLLPFSSILFLKKIGLVSDLYISKRSQRPIPFLLTLLFYFFWIIFLWNFVLIPSYIVGLSIGILFSISLLTLISLKWKISAHTSGIGALTGGVCGICYHLSIFPYWFIATLLFLSVLVAIARVKQKAHTPAQAIAGFALGFLSVFLFTILF